MIELSITNWTEAQSLVKPLRYQVFVIEQKVPEEMEWDEFDEMAWHAIVTADNQTVGTGRLILDGPIAKIGRMAVQSSRRNQGIGKSILNALIQTAKEKGAQECILHAQTHAIAFYAKADFEPNGPIFDEAGIPHVEMRLLIYNC
jgi:predicted GNAT family N-acyltransferase